MPDRRTPVTWEYSTALWEGRSEQPNAVDDGMRRSFDAWLNKAAYGGWEPYDLGQWGTLGVKCWREVTFRRPRD